jgi:hypothetical protein
MNKKTLLSLLVAVCFSIESGFAQWPGDSTNRINVCLAAGDQERPEITSDGAGGAIIVWQDGRGASTQIYAQRIDSSGVLRWTTNGIVICTGENSNSPKLVSDGAGGAMITWSDRRGGSWPNAYVCAQRVNGNGDTLWKANGVILTPSGSSWPYPQIVGYGGSGAIIVWNGTVGEVYAQKIDTTGTIQWALGGVEIDPEGSFPQTAGDGVGGAYIVWYRYDEEHLYTNIFGQHVNSNGSLQWFSDTVCYAPNYQLYPEVVSDGSGGAIVSWIDGREGTNNFPYASRLGTGGFTNWMVNGVQVSTKNAFDHPRLARDGSGGAVIAWWSSNSSDIFAQRINGSGDTQWAGDIRLTENTSPSVPRIRSDGATGVFVLWAEPGLGLVKVQHISSDGTFSFPPGGKAISTGNGLSGFLEGVTDGKGRIIVAWENTPLFDKNIYAHCTSVPGFPTGVSRGGQIGTAPQECALNQNYPNPFNPTTTITFTLAENSHVSLKVFDVLGREVAMLVNTRLNSGVVHQATLNASMLSTGVYFYRLEAGKNVQVKKLMLLK